MEKRGDPRRHIDGRFLRKDPASVFGQYVQKQRASYTSEFIDAGDFDVCAFFSIDVARDRSNDSDSRLIGRLGAFVCVGFWLAPEVQQSCADDPVPCDQCVDAVAHGCRVAANRLDHSFVGKAVDLLFVETELLQIRIDPVEPTVLQYLCVLVGEALMIDRWRHNGIAVLCKPFIVVL